ncbi:MAG: hypothetical protein RMM51_01210 [Verrucomicrobiae bacterium]|nr:hypothetical protein [Verrucomicrobiae bacterium]
MKRRTNAVWLWWVALGSVTAHVLIGAWSWDIGVQRFLSEFRPVGEVGARGTAGRVFLDNDPYCWLMYAQQMVEQGIWRVRNTDFDNVPFGREVHWSQSVSWCLVGLGWLIRQTTGGGWREAIEAGAVWLNPMLLVGWLSATGWVVARRLGVVPAVLWVVVVVTLPDVGWAFHPLRPDHQTFHWMFALGTAIALTFGGLGWVQAGGASRAEWEWWRGWPMPSRQEARWWFLGAGVLSGLGLWTGATVQFFAIGAVSVGALVLAVLMPARAGGDGAEAAGYDPSLWRWWGVTGMVSALVMYVVEYAPQHFAMRLEVNHPLYATAMWGVGEAMVVLTSQRMRGDKLSARDWARLSVSGLAMAAVPLLVWWGGADWHRMRDGQMSRLHEFITEFYSWGRFVGGGVWRQWWQGYGVLPVFALGAIWLAGNPRLRVQEWAALWLGFFLSWFFLALLFWQVRWAGAYALATAWVTVWVVYVLGRNKREISGWGRRAWATAAGAIATAQALWFGWNQQVLFHQLRRGSAWDEALVDAAMKRHLAEGLASASDQEALRVLCEADLGTALFYFGRIRSVTTFYWENVQGLHAATAVLAAREEEKARSVISERGLTHVLVPSDARLSAVLDYVANGRNAEQGRGTLLARLQQGDLSVPEWVQLDVRLTAIGRREFMHRGLGRDQTVESRISVYRFLDDKNHPSVTAR